MTSLASTLSSKNTLLTKLEASAITFVMSAFLGAALIFLVQPMFAKMATPLLGGSPSVWNVSLVCFQAALLGGYAYAHLLARLQSMKLQVGIHAGLLMLGLICLPLGITDALGTPSAEQPALWLIGVFLLSIALPFAAVSATAPLIQNWYSKTEREDANDPYHLYAASNLGSLLGLAAYPLLLEPFTRVATQSQVWSFGYSVLIALLLISGWSVARRQPALVNTANETQEAAAPLSMKERAIWLTLAFIPSSLLVGATTHMTTDIAAAPFLWVPPLALYIFTFVLVFAKKPPIPLSLSLKLMPVAIAGAALLMPREMKLGLPAEIGVTLLALFLAAMACHGLLAERRPHVSRLTEFYLIMSLGGVLGGAFNALLAPVLFSTIIEYPLMLALVLLVVPATQPNLNRTGRYALIFLGAVLVCASFLRNNGSSAADGMNIALIIAPILMMVAMRSRPIIVAAAFCTSWFAGTLLDPLTGGKAERGFFGVVKVMEGDGLRSMIHGTTLHGAQYVDEARRLQPLTYYGPQTPIGQAFELYNDSTDIGVVGLGVGSVACYAQGEQNWTFYEIDPIVVDLAIDPNRFTYISSCQPEARMVLGDARVQLVNEPTGAFDFLLLDAFSSDAIPAHLVTLEAMQLYLDKLSDDGVFVAHISNRHVALEHVFARLAALEGAHALIQFFVPEEEGLRLDVTPTNVIMIAKDKAVLKRAMASGKWEEITSDGRRPWTDDYSNMLGAMLEHAARH